jgi:methionyl-tRNA synthetase
MSICKNSNNFPCVGAKSRDSSCETSARDFYITTTIPYVNARPHIGHAQEFIYADSIARLCLSLGHRVVLQSGTDENAFKNVLAAKQAGEATISFVDRHSLAFQTLLRSLKLSSHTFVRTSLEPHRKGVELFWQRLKPEDLYEKSYQGLYCIGCEDFLTEQELNDGLCPDHKTSPQPVAERNLFFRLSRYQSQLEHLIASDQIRIVPAFRKNEVLQFIRRGLHDISLTRAATRSEHWGIRVPERPDQIIYVWIEALVNYLSGQGFGSHDSWQNIWSEKTHKVHVIGKNVWKFHAVYWPALLLSAKLPLPNDIVIHGFLTSEGQKISKSLGNSIDPQDLIERHGVDSLRHYLLHGLSVFHDSDFSESRLSLLYEQDLANRLGNLVSRLIALRNRAGITLTPNYSSNELWDTKNAALSSYALSECTAQAWALIDSINRAINEQRPWEWLKSTDSRRLAEHLQIWFDQLRAATELLACVLPQAAERVSAVLSSPLETTVSPLFPRRIR